MLIYLDNCCFNRPFDDQSQVRVRLETEAKLAVQERIRNGKIALAWSYGMDIENAANPFEHRRASIAAWRGVATVDVCESDEIVARAETLTQFGFRPKDALHISCAIDASCQVFLTTDIGILKRADHVQELAIVNPVDYDFDGDDDRY